MSAQRRDPAEFVDAAVRAALVATERRLDLVCEAAFLLQAAEYVDHLCLLDDGSVFGPAPASVLACPRSCPFTHHRRMKAPG